MAVNLPAGIDRLIFLRTVTAVNIGLCGVLEGTFRTRGVDEQDVFEFDVAFEIFWTFALIGEGVDTWNTIDCLKDLL